MCQGDDWIRTDYHDRYDYVSLPRLDRYPVFGGTSTVDYTPANNDAVGGLIECRNFTVPLGTTLLLRSDTTIRASGVVTILGTIKQNTVQPPNSIFRSNTCLLYTSDAADD